jgi:2-polyprenyl-6-methoxyphenol hydroxylase-like FAD-dependent oxidoreductase
MQQESQQIVIAGAGPTGLALGCELARLGVKATILDRLEAGANTSRAAVVHARTLEVLEPAGIAEELIQNGIVVPTFRIRDRSRILATVSFKDLDTPYPFTLMCPQDRTEAILVRHLQSIGGAVERPCEVVGIRQYPDDIEVVYNSAHGQETLRTKWLVGCDGMHSVVREQASIPFEGDAYEESFILADVELDWPIGREEVNLFFSEKGLAVVAPLPDNRFRIVATVEANGSEPSPGDFERVLKERGPDDDAVSIRGIAWASRFHIQHRVAKAFRKRRILLAGDAAHVHSPAGGQGMNTGIQDAVSLAHALHRALNGDPAALDEWERDRLKIAHSVVDFTDRMTRVATTSSHALQFLRNAAVQMAGKIPLVQHAMAERLSELDNR